MVFGAVGTALAADWTDNQGNEYTALTAIKNTGGQWIVSDSILVPAHDAAHVHWGLDFDSDFDRLYYDRYSRRSVRPVRGSAQ